MHNTGLVVSLALAGVLTLATCGQSGGDAANAPAPAPAPVPPAAAEAALPAEADLAAARAAAGQLGGELKAQLQAAMAAEGPVGGVRVCSEIAPQIASRISDATGMDVGRTALRVRNAGNTPDAWETAGLEGFAAEIAAGADPATLERAEIVTVDGQSVLRWMKPIAMGEMCATCHGADIGEDVAAAVAAAYPGDAATGFHPGELRGAFTVTKPLR